MKIHLQKSASIQPRTSLLNFGCDVPTADKPQSIPLQNDEPRKQGSPTVGPCFKQQDAGRHSTTDHWSPLLQATKIDVRKSRSVEEQKDWPRCKAPSTERVLKIDLLRHCVHNYEAPNTLNTQTSSRRATRNRTSSLDEVRIRWVGNALEKLLRREILASTQKQARTQGFPASSTKPPYVPGAAIAALHEFLTFHICVLNIIIRERVFMDENANS